MDKISPKDIERGYTDGLCDKLRKKESIFDDQNAVYGDLSEGSTPRPLGNKGFIGRRDIIQDWDSGDEQWL